MKYDKSYVAKKIVRKSSSYLKIAVGIFLSIMLLIATAGVFYINEYLQLDKNFFENEAVHTIKISYVEEDGKYVPLDESKMAMIGAEINKFITQDSYTIIPVYANCTGIVTQDGQMVKIFGVSNTDYRIVGDYPFEKNMMYFEKYGKENINLSITNYEITNDGGFIGKGITDLEFLCKDNVNRNSPILIFNQITSESLLYGFVDADTFLHISNILSNSNAKNISEISNNGLIELASIYVYVDDLGEVEKVSEILNEAGYISQCTFDAFDGFGDSFQKSLIQVVILGGFIFAISIIQLILSLNSYYQIQQKDIGILKYYGFSTKQIQGIYTTGLNMFFRIGVLFLSIYVVLISIITGVIVHYEYIIVFLICIWTVLLVLRLFIKKITICRFSKRNILFLLKNSKEVE